MKNLTEKEKILLIELLQQKELEMVSPKLEQFRGDYDFKVVTGGRGAGAKSRSIASLLGQKLNYSSKKWFCGREIQKTLEESSFSLIWETIERLGYQDWEPLPSRSRIVNKRNGSYFYFAGLKDEAAVKGLKGLENYDGAWIDEAENIISDVWDILLPTFRKEGSEIWISFNRNKELDPVYKLFFVNPPPRTLAIEVKEGKIDNPWFPEKLQRQLEHDYLVRPDIASHIWGGRPKKQGFNSVLSRVAVRAAMKRRLADEGPLSLGVDVARFGDDRTVMYLRRGMKVIKSVMFYGQDTQRTAREAWDLVGRDPSVPIKVDDTGVGGGVTDKLKDLGAKVIPINFGASANDRAKYKNLATEMLFELPIDEMEIPDDDELMDELSERLYDYDKNESKVIESKADFKKRYGKSPDKGDALMLCFFSGKTIEYDARTRAALRARG